MVDRSTPRDRRTDIENGRLDSIIVFGIATTTRMKVDDVVMMMEDDDTRQGVNKLWRSFWSLCHTLHNLMMLSFPLLVFAM